MVQNKPLISATATAIAIMSAPFASTAAAALYGMHVFHWLQR